MQSITDTLRNRPSQRVERALIELINWHNFEADREEGIRHMGFRSLDLNEVTYSRAGWVNHIQVYHIKAPYDGVISDHVVLTAYFRDNGVLAMLWMNWAGELIPLIINNKRAY